MPSVRKDFVIRNLAELPQTCQEFKDIQIHEKLVDNWQVVARLTHTSVVPMLSESQTKGLVLKAIQPAFLLVEEAEAFSKQTQTMFARRALYLNDDHPMVARILSE